MADDTDDDRMYYEKEAHEFERPSLAAVALAAELDEEDHWNSLHSVVEDCNIDDDDIIGCLKLNPETDRERELLKRFLALSVKQRECVLALHDGMIQPP